LKASSIYDLSLVSLISLLDDWGEPSFRAIQIWQGLYRNLWNIPDEFSNLPISLRQKLAEVFDFRSLLPISTQNSVDGNTMKTLFRLKDGSAIETVRMDYDPSESLQEDRPINSGQSRRTLCVSTQVGCAMGCVFCATGQMGFKRHLTSGEIVAQVMYYARLLRDNGENVTNVVIMGMGEPFHNYTNTINAIERLNDVDGYNLGARRFTISTVGLIPAIRRFTAEKRQINLAISLHSADDEIRSSMLPINTRYQISALLQTCRDYVAATGRRITFEWALVNGVNDTKEQALLLAGKIKGLLCHVNAIPLNPTSGYSGKTTTRQSAKEFKEILNKSGIPCTIRLRRGIDIQAGCGQLSSKN
jgi:23S rRNA (adenine2503-C2)-methyltransferase